MTFRKRSAAGSKGGPGAIDTQAADAAVLVSRWRCDDTTTTIADAEAAQNGTWTSVSTEEDPVANDGGNSVLLNGSTSKGVIPHNAAHALDEGSIYIKFQGAVELPPSGQQEIIIHKDAPAVNGGLELSWKNDSGQGRLRAYLKNESGTAFFVEELSTGVGTLDIDVGAEIVAAWGGGSFDVWIDRVLVGSASIDNGIANNSEDWGIGHYIPTGVAFLSGFIDEIRLYSGRLTQADLDAGEDPEALAFPTTLNVTPPGGSPSTGFACENREAPTVTTTYKDLGNTTTRIEPSVGGDARYDMTGTIFDNDYDAGSDTYDPSFNIYFNTASSNHDGGCMFGGVVLNGYAPALTAARNYPSNDGGQVLIRNTEIGNFTICGFVFKKCWDPIRTGTGVTVPNSGDPVMVIYQCYFDEIVDDVCEDDNHEGYVFDDCLVDGTFTGFSDRSGTAATGRTTKIFNSLVRMVAIHDDDANGPWHFLAFKLGSASNDFLIQNATVRADALSKLGAEGQGSLVTPFYDLINNDKQAAESTGNIFADGTGSAPTMPDGWTRQTDMTTYWDEPRAAWISAKSHVVASAAAAGITIS